MGKLTPLILAAVAVILIAASPAAARCFKFQRDCTESSSTPTRSYIVSQHRQKVGDLYDPGHGPRVQIRDTSRRIIGYIEADGRITNTSRQKVGTID